LCKDPERNREIDSASGKPYTHGIPGSEYWVDCIGNGRDIRYSWGADGNDWVCRLAVLSKKRTLTDPGKKLEKWLHENYFDEVPHGYSRKKNLSEAHMLDRDGAQTTSIAKAIAMSRLGR